MADDELSRSSAGDDEFEELDDNGEDYEATLDEEEALDGPEDYSDELRDLEDEGNMDIEELRRKYGCGPPEPAEESEEDTNGDTEDTDQERNDIDYFANACDEEADTDPEADKDYRPPNSWAKEVRIDPSMYQADIPSFCVDEKLDENLHNTAPIWTPTDMVTNQQIDDYLVEICRMREELGQMKDSKELKHRYEEDALFALLRAGYDIEKAKNSFSAEGFPYVNHPVSTVRSDALQFDDKEMMEFESAMTTIGKNFHNIQKTQFPYRLVGELVEYYYSWKKTERYHAYRRRQQQPEAAYTEFAVQVMSSSDTPMDLSHSSNGLPSSVEQSPAI